MTGVYVGLVWLAMSVFAGLSGSFGYARTYMIIANVYGATYLVNL